MASKKEKAQRPVKAGDAQGRSYVSQADVPAHSLDEALRVAKSLADNFGKNPTKPLRLAQAMELSPGSSLFRMLCGASIAYGLTEGGYNSESISLTVLGRRIVAPTQEGDDVAARREASLRPRIVRDFLSRYNESKLPPPNIGANVLEELHVPTDRAPSVYNLIVESARSAGFLREVKGQTYVDLESLTDVADVADGGAGEPAPNPGATGAGSVPERTPPPAKPAEPPATTVITGALKTSNRVFITHGQNREIVDQLKELLTFGGFTPVVAIETETVSKPVPDKVMDEMRSCGAAVIHVGAEKRVIDGEGKEHHMLNQNVLIEIGAAMALYGRKFILLVEKGATLPSNLQGLYEVRHEGGKLDYESTMRLLKAFNDFRS